MGSQLNKEIVMESELVLIHIVVVLLFVVYHQITTLWKKADEYE